MQKQLSKYGLSDTPTAWVGIGQLCYEDYRKNAVCSRAQCIDIFSGIAGDMVQGANLYALKGKSWVYDVWMRGDMHRISDVQIPWTAMVLSGSVGMISTAGNDTGDLQELEMQWLEYGCVPSFELTWESASKLQDSNVTSLYSSGAQPVEGYHHFLLAAVGRGAGSNGGPRAMRAHHIVRRCGPRPI